MTRFQLVFRQDGEDHIETHDNNHDGEPHINGELIVDGQTYVIRDVEWVVSADHIGDMKRFICTLLAVPLDQ